MLGLLITFFVTLDEGADLLTLVVLVVTEAVDLSGLIRVTINFSILNGKNISKS